MPVKDSAFLKKARERFKLANDADSAQAQRERDDLAFYAGDQWPADIKLARQGQQALNGMPAVPARPTLVINKVKEPVRQILNQERASDIGIELVPADDFGDLGITPDDTEVTLREGLTRRIQRESQAADARTWAFARAVQAGRGYYLVMTRFLPGKTWDQEIYVHRIYNQAGVLLDPAHESPDGSDADWGFIGTWVPWERYHAEFPTFADGKKNEAMNDSEFMGLTEAYPDWYRAEGEQKAVRVVDYWYVERTSKRLAVMDDGTSLWEDELPEDAQPADVRTVVEKTIQFCKIGGGIHELEKTDWAGPDMPIVKVLGDELQPYDHQRRAEGMVRQARDSQMGFNYMVSKQVEILGLTPIPLLQLDPEAIDGYEEWYKVLNTRTLPYAPYRSYDDQARPLNGPTRLPVDPNILPIAQAVGLFDAAIKSTTAVPDPTLGNVDPSLKSGKAIREVVANAQQSTSNFLDNLARSIRYEGQIINNLLFPIYGAKPGRLVRILTGEGEGEMMQIGERQTPQEQQKAAKVAKLTKDAHFNVIVKVTKAFDSRRQQEASSLGDLIAAEPQLMTWFGDLYLGNGDLPNRKSLAERAKVMLAPPIQQMLAQQEQGQEPIPAAAQQQIAMLTERLQHAEQAMQELAEEAKGKMLEAKTKLEIEDLRMKLELQKAQIEAERDVQLQSMKDATQIDVARITAETKGIVSAQEATDEAIALGHIHGHEATQAALDREHERTMATTQLAHAAAMNDGQQDFQADQADADRQAAAEAAEGTE